MRIILGLLRCFDGAGVSGGGYDLALTDRAAWLDVRLDGRQVGVAGYKAAWMADPDLPAAQPIQTLGRRAQAGQRSRYDLVVLSLAHLDVIVVRSQYHPTGHCLDGRSVADRHTYGALVEVEAFVAAIAVGAQGAGQVRGTGTYGGTFDRNHVAARPVGVERAVRQFLKTAKQAGAVDNRIGG